ncbi:MAG TPA: magnesium/cobalt transporter CorA [Edaphocola sp.]|nr:magnesium/cobalt transporter CorA [Edaphocola sp.]
MKSRKLPLILHNNYLSAYRKKAKRYTYHPEEVKGDLPGETNYNIAFTIFNRDTLATRQLNNDDELEDLFKPAAAPLVKWIDITGVIPRVIRKIGQGFHIHSLIINDILSVGQRAKEDDMGTYLFVLMPMLAYNQESGIIDTDQICLVLGEGYLISVHNNAAPAYLKILEEKLKSVDSPARCNNADYIFYLILDAVVDQYFNVLDKLSEQLDNIEDIVVDRPQKSALLTLTMLRHKIMVVKRAIAPVRELINNLWHADNKLIDPNSKKYFKDIYDHITLAIEYNENYREMVLNLQDLYMNQVNTRMNEVMKILTIVTMLLAPFMLISGIYGMNFEHIPFNHAPYGFGIAVLFMLATSIALLFYFRKKGWF